MPTHMHTLTSRKPPHVAQEFLERTLHRSIHPPASYDGKWKAGAHNEPYGAVVSDLSCYDPQYAAAPSFAPLPSTPRMIIKGQQNPRTAVAQTHISSTSFDDTHVLTAQTVQRHKYPFDKNETPRDLSGSNSRDKWVADSGASYHVTGDPTETFVCKPSPEGKERLVIGDMTMMYVECLASCRCRCTARVVTSMYDRRTWHTCLESSLSCSHCML